MMQRLRAFYHSLPPWALSCIRPFHFLITLTAKHELFLLDGTEKAGGKPLRVACAGQPDLKVYLLKRVFAPGATERSLGWVPVRWTPKTVAARCPEADLLFWHLRRPIEALPRPGVLARLPSWVRLELDLQDRESLKRGKDKFGRIAKATQKAGFTTRMGRTEAESVDFYRNMHLPYVNLRHGEGASIESEAETYATLRSGERELILLERGGEVVAGGTVEITPERARFWQLGVRDGDLSLMEAGVSDAVYHRVIELTRERGCRVLHLGHSRPFARDGVFEYKRMLGGYVSPNRFEAAGCIEVSVLRKTPAVDDFLADNGLVSLERDGSYAFYCFTRGTPEEKKKREEWCRERYCFKGTLAFRVFDLDGPAVTPVAA